MKTSEDKCMVEKVIFGDDILAIIIYAEYKSEGINFFTPGDFSQQLGYMSHPKGHQIKPHVHNHVSRNVDYTKEVLLIKSGSLRVDFYNENQNYLESKVLKKGDVILLAFGGHGFEVLEECEIIEIKQGPYAGESDKTRFEPISKELIKL